MFKIDEKRIQSCIEHRDYCSAIEYAILVREKYKDKERDYFEKIISCFKSGKYNI